MRTLAGLCCIVAIAAIAGAKEEEKIIPVAPLTTLVQAIQPALKNLEPMPTIEYRESNTLAITYLPQTFKIHGSSKSGEYAKEAHDEVGPSVKGFILLARVQPKGSVNQAVTPQTLRRPYWLTDLDVTGVGNTDHQLYWGLSYGARTDAKLLDDLRTRVRALQGERAQQAK